MNYKSTVQYESKGKTPDGNPFMTIKQSRGYYEYAERGGIDSICFILYNRDTQKYGLIYESKPPRDEIENKLVKMLTAFGGSIDSKFSYKEICQIEVLEESGYHVPLDSIYSVGKTLVSSQMSQMCEGFLVDITGIKKTHNAEHEYQLDDPSFTDLRGEFIGNEVRWIDINEMLDNNDWKSIWILTKYFNQ